MEKKYILAIIREVASQWYSSPTGYPDEKGMKPSARWKDLKESSIQWAAVEGLINYIEDYDCEIGGVFEGILDPIHVIYKYKKLMAQGTKCSHSKESKYIFRTSMGVAQDMLDVFEAAMR